jgi:N-methylhydantoinase A/oxoprolinase/acetone carboxylase beta subunit
MAFRIGCDVGSTHTDAVLLEGRRLVAWAKVTTTADVTSGIAAAVGATLTSAGIARDQVAAVTVGTTHFTNAVVERRDLSPVACVRMGAPGTGAIPPLSDWPDDLVDLLGDAHFIVQGGYEFDGREISPVDPAEIRRVAAELRRLGIRQAAVAAVFAPLRADCELVAARILCEDVPGLDVTLSHDLGHLGLLERENAAVLNACLRPLARATVRAITDALARLDIAAPLYLTQNDGTVMASAYAERFPVLTFASGPANSMRGAAYLSGLEDAIVVDVGGTTSDFGALVRGFPREAGIAVSVGGVRTNFRMPDLYSIGLGGGSLVAEEGRRVGPRSVGHRLTSAALIFGGATLTASDLAVAGRRAAFGDPARVGHLAPELVERALATIDAALVDAVDHLKLSPDPVTLVAVGGGSILVPAELPGVTEVLRPPHADVANAIGAAIAQVSGEVEQVFSLEQLGREEAIARASAEANRRALAAGACPDTLRVVDVDDMPLTYLPHAASRIRVRVVGDLSPPPDASARLPDHDSPEFANL